MALKVFRKHGLKIKRFTRPNKILLLLLTTVDAHTLNALKAVDIRMIRFFLRSLRTLSRGIVRRKIPIAVTVPYPPHGQILAMASIEVPIVHVNGFMVAKGTKNLF